MLKRLSSGIKGTEYAFLRTNEKCLYFSTKSYGELDRKRLRTPLKTRLRKVLDEDSDDCIDKSSTANSSDIQISKPELFKVNDILSSRVEEFFSQDIHKLLKAVPSFNVRHGLVFRFLGTSVDRVQNSYLVAEDIEEQLKSGDLNKAVYIAKLARSNGAVGMNLILKYILSEEFDFSKTSHINIKDRSSYQDHLAHKIYGVLRKWGVPDNSHTYSILHKKVNGGVRIDKKGIDNLIDKYESSIAGLPWKNATVNVNANVTLAALADKASMDQIIDFYDNIPRKDKITYTTVLNIIGRRPDGAFFRDKVWKDFLDQTRHRQGIQLDGPLARSYLFATMKEEGGFEMVLDQYEDYFDLNGLVDITVKDGKATPSSSPVLDNKFDVGRPELTILLKCLYKTENYDKIFQIFDELQKKDNSFVDIPHYNVYIKSIEARGAVNLISPLLDLLTTGNDLRPSAEMYASLIRTFINSGVTITSKELTTVNHITRLSKNGSKNSRLLPPVASAYCDLFNYIYGNPSNKPSSTFDRTHGLKALKIILSSISNLPHSISTADTTFQPQIDMLKSIIKLCEQLEKRRWSNEISTWMYKSRKALSQFAEALQKTTLAHAHDFTIKSSINEFNDKMTTVSKILTSK